MRQSTKDRFWKYVNKQGPKHPVLKTRCWLWTGSILPYGQFGYHGKTYKAHRFAWKIATGKWPKKFLLHKCDVPGCIRYEHCFEGDHKKNMADMVSKGRQATGDRNASRLYPERLPRGKDWFQKHPIEKRSIGERNRHAKLTEKQVKKIRKLWSTGNYYQRELAERYNVLQTTIGRIVTNQTWRLVA